MSRSRKDGRHGGGHRDWLCREVWSRRCRIVTMWRRSNRDYKRITHKYERREARRFLRAVIGALTGERSHV